MQPDRPVLTIAIPTYSRSSCLSELLDVLTPQLQGEKRVELLISDNASIDDTPFIVSAFRTRGLQCRYVRNQTNIGADANFAQCFRQARGKYVWLLGDDDIVVSEGVSKLLRLLSAGDYSLIHLAPFPFRTAEPTIRISDRLHRFAQEFENGVLFAQVVGPMVTFISSIIVNGDRFREIPHPDLDTLVGSNLIQLGWVLPLMAAGGRNLIVWDRILAARVGNSGGYGICRVFSNNFNGMLGKLLPANVDIQQILRNQTLTEWFPTTILQIRDARAGSMEEESYHQLLRQAHKENWRYWAYVFPVITLPLPAARLWWRGTQFLNRAVKWLKLLLTYPQWRRNLIRHSKNLTTI